MKAIPSDPAAACGESRKQVAGTPTVQCGPVTEPEILLRLVFYGVARAWLELPLDGPEGAPTSRLGTASSGGWPLQGRFWRCTPPASPKTGHIPSGPAR